jgi:hypothetical protein
MWRSLSRLEASAPADGHVQNAFGDAKDLLDATTRSDAVQKATALGLLGG